MTAKIKIIVACAGVSLVGVCASLWLAFKAPHAPTTLVIRGCGEVRAGMQRIGNASGVQFDVPRNAFRISEGTQDMPPFEHGFRISTIATGATLSISFGPPGFPGSEEMGVERISAFSKQVEKRNVLDPEGFLFGEDDWGYTAHDQVWRHTRIHGLVHTEYEFATQKDAVRFDRIINSGCILAATAH